LPDDGIGDRMTRLPVPDDGGFTLVGDADSSHVGGAHTGAGQHLDRDASLRRPDFRRVVLDPHWLRKNLSKLALRDALYPAISIEQNGARARRALVKGEDVRHMALRAEAYEPVLCSRVYCMACRPRAIAPYIRKRWLAPLRERCQPPFGRRIS